MAKENKPKEKKIAGRKAPKKKFTHLSVELSGEKYMGAPCLQLDWKVVDRLLSIQSTLREVASFFNVSEDTIERRCKEERGVTFAEYSRQKGAEGKRSLRRKMHELAMKGDKTMLIWLSKQYLDMSDKSDTRNLNINENHKIIRYETEWGNRNVGTGQGEGGAEEDSSALQPAPSTTKISQ